MTLTTPYSANFIVGDGETKTFSYLFEEVSANFIDVIVYNSVSGVTSTPTYTIDTEQKQVIFGDDTPAPTADDVVCIYRNTPVIQDVQFRTLHGYDAKTMENILSKIVAMIQEIKSNYLTTDVLQGDPWQIDLMSSADDGATLVIDYVAKKFTKGLYFKITSGNLQASSDGVTYITMPKSADIAEFRQQQTELPDHTYEYRLQYRVGSNWFVADSTSKNIADAAYSLAETVQIGLSAHVNNQNNPHDTSMTNLIDTDFNNLVSGQFLQFDGIKWRNVNYSAVCAWGGIGGNINDQIDLKNALDGKVSKSGDTMSGTLQIFMSRPDLNSPQIILGGGYDVDARWRIFSEPDGTLSFMTGGKILKGYIFRTEVFSPFKSGTKLGEDSSKWAVVYAESINNGAAITIPSYSGTMIVADASGATSGQVLTLGDGSVPLWRDSPIPQLGGLADVTITSATSGDVLTYNGSAWVNQAIPIQTVNFSINGGNYTAGTGSYAITRFSLMLQKADGTWEKPTDTSVTYSQATNKTVNTNGFLLNQILYYNHSVTVSSGQLTGLNRVYSKHATVPVSYSTNCGTTPGWALGTWFYLVGTLGADGLFYLDTTQWWSVALPNSADGKLYIRLGPVSSSDSAVVALLEDRPIFYHDGNGVKEYVVRPSDIPTVNNPTITIRQGGVDKGSFTLNQSTADTIDLDAGGGASGGQEIDADIVGTPTISGSIVSNFSSSNYLKLPGVFELGSSDTNSFEIGASFTTTSVADSDMKTIITGRQPGSTNNAAGIEIRYADFDDQKIRVVIINGANQTLTGTTNLSPNTKYYIKFEYDGADYKLWLSTDGASYSLEVSAAMSKLATPAELLVGKASLASPQSVDMAGLYIKKNGQIIWQGMDAPGLHQRVAKGHEVIAFQAPTAGNNYTWYRKYADGWVEQGGLVRSNSAATVSVVYPVAFADANYTLTIGLITTKDVAVGIQWAGAQTKSSTGCEIRVDSEMSKDWMAAGMAA